MADEVLKNTTTPAAAAAAPAAATPGLQQQFENRQAESAGKINNLYDMQLNNQKAALETAYQQNLSDQEAARDQIGKTYQSSANDLAIQYERNRRNLNTQAMANGLNTGAGSQQQLALNQQYLTNYGKLRGQEAAAMTEANRQIVNLKNNYQNAITQAIAQNDYQRAAALLDDYNNQNKWYESNAQLLAGYGNFDAYKSLYGEDITKAMQSTWALQNPDVAWAQGKITGDDYYKLTGRYPTGYTPGAGTGGAGGGYGGDWGTPQWFERQRQAANTPPQVDVNNDGNLYNDTIKQGYARVILNPNR